MATSTEHNDRPPFWCHICEVGCLSAINLQTHFLGVKHRKLEDLLKSFVLGEENPNAGEEAAEAPSTASQPPRTLEEQLDTCRSTEPAIGLEYLREYRTGEKHVSYVCTLCDCESGMNNMFMHVVGSKHRLAYLSKHYPERAHVQGRGAVFNRNLRRFAAEVEDRDGRKNIQVVIISLPAKKKSVKEEKPSEDQSIGLIGPFVEDTTNDDTAASNQGSSESSLELRKIQGQSAQKQPQEKSTKIGKHPGTFATNNGLLQFLDQFQVVCDDDVDFVLSINESFTKALAQYQLLSGWKPEMAVVPKETNPAQQASASLSAETAVPPKTVSTQQVPTAESTASVSCDNDVDFMQKVKCFTESLAQFQFLSAWKPEAGAKVQEGLLTQQAHAPSSADERVHTAVPPQTVLAQEVTATKTTMACSEDPNQLIPTIPALKKVFRVTPKKPPGVLAQKKTPRGMHVKPAYYNLSPAIIPEAPAPKRPPNFIFPAQVYSTLPPGFPVPDELPKPLYPPPGYCNIFPPGVPVPKEMLKALDPPPGYYDISALDVLVPEALPNITATNPDYYNTDPAAVPSPEELPKATAAKTVSCNTAPVAAPTPKKLPKVKAAKPVYRVISAKPVYYKPAPVAVPEPKAVEPAAEPTKKEDAVVPSKKRKKAKM